MSDVIFTNHEGQVTEAVHDVTAGVSIFESPDRERPLLSLAGTTDDIVRLFAALRAAVEIIGIEDEVAVAYDETAYDIVRREYAPDAAARD